MHGQVDRSLFLCSYDARFKIIRELSYKMFNSLIVQKYFLLQKNISYYRKIFLTTKKYILYLLTCVRGAGGGGESPPARVSSAR